MQLEFSVMSLRSSRLIRSFKANLLARVSFVLLFRLYLDFIEDEPSNSRTKKEATETYWVKELRAPRHCCTTMSGVISSLPAMFEGKERVCFEGWGVFGVAEVFARSERSARLLSTAEVSAEPCLRIQRRLVMTSFRV
jgi:hypothetical protein